MIQRDPRIPECTQALALREIPALLRGRRYEDRQLARFALLSRLQLLGTATAAEKRSPPRTAAFEGGGDGASEARVAVALLVDFGLAGGEGGGEGLGVGEGEDQGADRWVIGESGGDGDSE